MYGPFEDSGAPVVTGPQPNAYSEDVTLGGGELGYRVGPRMRLAFRLYQQNRIRTSARPGGTAGPWPACPSIMRSERPVYRQADIDRTGTVIAHNERAL